MRPHRLDGDTGYFDVSAAGFDRLPQQIEDAVAFLRRYKADVDALMALPSASGCLDFGVENREIPVPFGRLSPELVCLAGKAGLSLDISFSALAEVDRPGA